MRCSSLILLLFVCGAAQAKHLDPIGPTYPIQENDALEVVLNTVTQKVKSGEYQRWMEEGKKRAVESFKTPRPINGLARTSAPHSHYWDPTVVVNQDIRAPDGQVILAKGTRSNPFDYLSLTKHLLFFDGRDKDQVRFARKIRQRYKDGVKLILVGGSPVELGREWKHPVFFDQSGYLVAKLAIRQVPALAYQEGKRIRIDEIMP